MITAPPPSDFEQFIHRVDQAMNQLASGNFSRFRVADRWTPAVNIYRLPDRLEVCVDLAGVDRKSIDMHVEPGRLTVRGVRPTPAPCHEPGPRGQIIVMEIEHGPFERTLPLPREVNLDAVEAEQCNGMLWIRLPLRNPAGR